MFNLEFDVCVDVSDGPVYVSGLIPRDGDDEDVINVPGEDDARGRVLSAIHSILSMYMMASWSERLDPNGRSEVILEIGVTSYNGY